MNSVINAPSATTVLEPEARWSPDLPAPLIDRPHLVETLEAALQSSSVLFIQGDDGDGVTTLLTQFAERHRESAVCLFVKPAGRMSYSVDYLRRLLAEQYHWHLKREPLSTDLIGADVLDTLLLKLRVQAKVRKRTIYFVVDGVHQIPNDDKRSIELILRDLLPTGVDAFKFLIAGRQTDLSPFLGKEVSSTQQMLKLSKDEARQFLDGLDLSSEEMDEIVRVAAGNPGKLASIRRMIQSGTPWRELPVSAASAYPDFIKAEFADIECLADVDRLAIATLAHSRHPMTIDDIAETIPDASVAQVTALLARVTYLLVGKDAQIVEFTSETHRRIAETMTEALRARCHQLQVDRLLKAPNSSNALRFLPTYFQQLGNAEALVKLLAHPSHYLDLLVETQSLASLQSRAAIGFRSARELERLAHVLQFSIQRSIFSSLGPASDSPAEISALVALGLSQQALALAARSTTREGRLMLIAQYARGVTDRPGSTLDPEVLAYIRELAAGMDFRGWGESAVGVAENLIGIDIDLALTIVDEAVKGEGASEDSDSLYARLAVDASMGAGGSELASEKVGKRISSDALRHVVSSIQSVFRDLAIDEVIKLVSELRIERKVYLLRALALKAQDRIGALRVVDYALDEMIAASAYRPKALDLADLATPLAHANATDIPAFLRRFESQVTLIDQSSSSPDYVILQMRLARAESVFDLAAARTRIENTFLFSADVENAESQLLCLSAMLTSLAELVKTELCEVCEEIGRDIKLQLEAKIRDLLANAADHLKIFTPLIDSACVQDPDFALGLVERFNLERSRNDGMVRVAAEVARQPLTTERVAFVVGVVGRLQGLPREIAIHALNKSLRKTPKSAERTALIRRLATMATSPDLVCHMQIAMLAAMDESTRAEADVIVTRLRSHLEQIDELTVKVDICFQASAALAEFDKDAASGLYDLADNLRRSARVVTRGDLMLLLACLSLATRTIHSLMKFGLQTDEMLQRLTALRDLMTPLVNRVYVSSELVIRAWCERKTDLAQRIYDEQCAPILNGADNGTNVSLMQNLVLNSILATYCVHKNAAFAALEKYIPPMRRAMVLEDMCLLVLRRIPPSEPSGRLEAEYHKVAYATALDVIEILSHTQDDSSFARCLAQLCTVFGHKDNRHALTHQQRADVNNRILEMISQKLPDQNNIRHDGYVIVAKAYLGRMMAYRPEDWRAIVAQADAIPNVADRCFVYLEICSSMPSKGNVESDRRQLLEKAKVLIDQLPSVHDRYSRLEMYVSTAKQFDPAEATSALKKAVVLSANLGADGDAAHKRRTLVDLAELIKPGLADELSAAIDDDPARAEAKAEIQRAAEVQKVKREIASSKRSMTGKDTEHLPSAAWKNLGSLLANRLETQPPDRQIDLLEKSARLPMNQAYPVLSWYLENMAKRFTKVRAAEEFLVPANEVVLLCAEMAGAVVSEQHRATVAAADGIAGLVESNPRIMVLPGMRAKALDFIETWVRTHCRETIVCCDPYFSENDLVFLRFVLAADPDARLVVLTSQQGIDISRFKSDVYYREWQGINDAQDPPRTEFIALGNTASSGPIHDRWIICGEHGLSLGTSFNSLGMKVSEIAVMDAQDALVTGAELRKYCDKERIVGGQRVDYLSITI